jgi:hypothetical protein
MFVPAPHALPPGYTVGQRSKVVIFCPPLVRRLFTGVGLIQDRRGSLASDNQVIREVRRLSLGVRLIQDRRGSLASDNQVILDAVHGVWPMGLMYEAGGAP